MNGVIAAGGKHTAQAGADMLKQGGNAVDAAVAAAFASFTTEVAMVHWGGSGIAQLYDPSTQQAHVYDFFSNMPGLGGGRDSAELDFNQVSIQFSAASQSFHIGRGAVAVPGNIFGLCQLAADWGKLPLKTLLQPALTLAQTGFKLSPYQAMATNLLKSLVTATPEIAQIFSGKNGLIGANEPFHIPHLADTLTALGNEGADYLRNGALGRKFVADQQQNGGLITQTDLERYQVAHSKPLRIRYHDHEILLPALPSVGGVLVAFTLKLLSNFSIRKMGPQSAASYRLLHEALAATSRARPVLDAAVGSDSAETLTTHFLSDQFAAPYLAQINDAIASNTPSRASADPQSHPNTSHISVIDGTGLAVSLTTTAGESAGYVVPETGFIPNNMLGEADLNPHGWHKWQPGQRLPTMMTPTIVLKDGMTRLVLGSGGSERIRSATVQVISNLIDHKMKLAAAVNASRIHIENGVLQCEGGTHQPALDQLESWGYRLNRWENVSMYFGGAHAASRTPEGRLVAAADPRRDGHTQNRNST